MDETPEWVLLAYRIPREPSTPRISVWRKLRRLGAVQMLDGLVGLPGNARSRELLEWIADDVRVAGGEADIWLGRPSTKAQQRRLESQLLAGLGAECDEIVDQAQAAETLAAGSRRRVAGRLRRDLDAIRRREVGDRGDRQLARAQKAIARLDAISAAVTAR